MKILAVPLLISLVICEVKKFEFVIQDWVVDYMRPTPNGHTFSLPWQKNSNRKSPFDMKEEVRKHALLINGQYPGPEINVYENDTIVVTVINKMGSESATLHWHGIFQIGTPYMDGSNGIAQAAILPGQSFTYEFLAFPAGSHWYHSHIDAVQSAQGIKGALIVKKRNDPFQNLYSEELTINVSDEWREPGVCLRLEGAIPGNDVCADVRMVSWNGIYGDGSPEYPYPTIEVEKGTCYRMRFIFMGVNTENLIISMAGHRMLLIAKDGVDLTPINVTSFNMHLGERYDVIVCADQDPGNYLISAKYDYACTLTPGHFIPPGFSAVPACEFYSFLNYKGHKDSPINQRGSPITAPPLGTGGGANPKSQPGVDFDLTKREGYFKTTPLNPEPEPEEPDVRYVVNMGLKGPAYSGPTDEPMTKGRYYLDIDTYLPGRPWTQPSSPLYLTKGRCGAEGRPIVDIPETAQTVEVVINNLSPAAHVLHMHGQTFKVINFADHKWCNLNRTDCFLRPHWLQIGGCDKEDVSVGDPQNPNVVGGLYWGCKFNSKKNLDSQNLKTPLSMDTIQVWQRSWAVIRFKATNPGWWFFHCHMEQHIPLGMQMIFNILPSKQALAPSNMPTAGNCPMVGMKSENPMINILVQENEELRQKLRGHP